MQRAAWFPADEQVRKMRMYGLMMKNGIEEYDDFYQRSVKDPAWFWDEVVRDLKLQWDQPYSKVLDLSKGFAWPQWFVDGKMNVATNCLDRWADDPKVKDQLAIISEGDGGEVKQWTYHELRETVARFAQGLSELGVTFGDRVAIYLPMIAENVIAMLATARIGAIFTPCFSGYGAEAVATRLKDCEAKVLITADGFWRRGKVVKMKEEADRAADLSPSVEKVIIVQRTGREIPVHERDVKWEDVIHKEKTLSSVITDADTPFMIIYTSGTTGRPKGTVHVHAGFPIKAAFDAGYGMDLKQEDTLFWMTDMGWMMGPWMVFGALLNGSTMVLFEGTPDYPQPDRLWELVENHRISHMGISPTVIRTLMKFGETWVDKHDQSSLKAFGSTGEPWNPEPWFWLFDHVGKGKVPIWNYSGGTEVSGGILSSNLMKPIAPCSFNGPMPGMDAEVVDEHGKPIRGEVGELVMKHPWVGMTHGFWKDPERYKKAYWSRWEGTWVHGDWVHAEEEGYWYITGRSDDTLKIAGKRLGPAEMESVLVDHPRVLEAATIGVPDPIKGEVAVCFAVLKPGDSGDEVLVKELMDMIGDHLGKALRPSKIHVVSELPKTRNGKILRRVIKSAYTGQEAGDLSALENPKAVEEVRRENEAE
ncbi:AMP-binding protein [Marininema halotolerans]|uniref:acetate--CoA ligase n=1 Tax=Marininema halotolerans TaxID=1155944 RepID=A0A1I6REJ9_9BACL|nr:AMP-binding protein [Marininema halotolerans]SFS63075.1 acetyl-CoA synthetase [Marininema halotolerans]